MTVNYKKITIEDWDYQRNIPKCPDKGAFEVDFITHLFINGICIFFIVDGEIHREDGPAVIYSNEVQYYCRHNKLHRTDGPAVIWADGSKEYFLFDQKYSKKQWKLKVLHLKLKVLHLNLKE